MVVAELSLDSHTCFCVFPKDTVTRYVKQTVESKLNRQEMRTVEIQLNTLETRTGESKLYRLETKRDERSTASSAAIQTYVAPSLGAPVSSQTIRRRLAEGHLRSRHPLHELPLKFTNRRASVRSGASHEETGLQRNGTRSSLVTNPDSISAVMAIVFVCGDPVVIMSQSCLCFTATHHSNSWCDANYFVGCHLGTGSPISRTPVASRALRRRVAEEHLGLLCQLRVLSLTPIYQHLRLEWCHTRGSWTATEWNQVVFSDKSRFNLSSDDNRVCMCRPLGERFNHVFALQRHTAPTAGVMVWGAIAYNTQSSLVLIRGTMTGQRLVLQSHDDSWEPLPLMQWLPGAIFQQKKCLALHSKGVSRLSPHCYYPSFTSPIPRFASNRAYLG
ncbi:transposable element Tcb1 transposase [Trichonephila clavipes]|nr:transposable element Tcb1 transposase [Trichonephila clavipes]